MKQIAIIIATLNRPSLQDTIRSIKAQNVDVELLVRCDPNVNEYKSRDLAIKDSTAPYIAFIDDDAYYEPNAIKNALKYLKKGYVFVEGLLQGDFFGTGFTRLTQSNLGVGTAQFMTREAYDKVGGFRLDWGTEPKTGWRMDTALLYDIFREYGEEKYIHAEDVVITHPRMMQSAINPDVEHKFYLEYKSYVEKYILPIDPRLQQYVKLWGGK